MSFKKKINDKERHIRRIDILDVVDNVTDAIWQDEHDSKLEERVPKSRHEELSNELKNTESELQEKLDVYYAELAKIADDGAEDNVQLRGDIRDEVVSLKSTSANLQRSCVNTMLMADELEARLHDVEKSMKKHKLLKPAPPNSVIDMKEQNTSYFAKGMNFYKLFLICFAGSFVGVVLELFWCLFTNGYIESRSGLVYGPFNLLYGVGAVALTLALYRYRNHSGAISFVGGMIVGSVLEYVCSWGQELLIGSRSWDYSGMPFNLNGRICLMFSVIWGLLGVLWIKNIYPRIAKLILKIPNKAGKITTWILLVFIVFNMIVTGFALARWTGRINGVEASSAFGEFIDERFPDERMERIFANMEFNNNKSENEVKYDINKDLSFSAQTTP